VKYISYLLIALLSIALPPAGLALLVIVVIAHHQNSKHPITNKPKRG